MTVGSLFAGIGGFDLGFERAGFEVRWQVEIDRVKRRVLEEWWPGVERFEDITTISERDLTAVDVVTAGFPCQDISTAGRRAGITGAKSGLWSHVPRILRGTGCRYLLLENSPSLLKRGLDRVLGDLARCGFDAEWDVLPAAAFGSPQLRARLWILAYPSGVRKQADETVFAGRGLAQLCARWSPEPCVRRVADGVPASAHRLHGLGDSIVPQIAEWIAHRIKEAEDRERQSVAMEPATSVRSEAP